MIARDIGNVVLQDRLVYKVIGITGPRQSGKTTLMKTLFPDMLYANLEDPSQREFAESDPKGFLAQNHRGMMIDEIQRVPDLLSYIQTDVDARDEPGRYIISGSQNILLMERISQTLAGRISLFTLLPFSPSWTISALCRRSWIARTSLSSMVAMKTGTEREERP